MMEVLNIMSESQNGNNYVALKNVQVLIAMLKEYGIDHIVLSPGGRNVPFVHSVENDPYFTCYSVVDERSAAFFGIGLIHSLKKPVAICCTSATASCNYLSGVTEAFYQHLPLVVLTADRNSYYLNQDEEQMIPQISMYNGVCKKEVSLPIVQNAADEWYCGRVINEALSELNHGTIGPVHINFQIENILTEYTVPELPPVKRIKRVGYFDAEEWQMALEEAKDKKIMVIFGQHLTVSDELKNYMELFSETYNCVVCTDLLSNLHIKRQVNTINIASTSVFQTLDEMLPDIVITMGGNYLSTMRNWLKSHEGDFSHWKVSKGGEFADQFKNLTKVFECEEEFFLKQFTGAVADAAVAHQYFDQWKKAEQNVAVSDFPWSSIYAAKEFIHNIPDSSKLHIANSNSVRLSMMFELNPTVEVFCNRGCNGIDGSMSAFIGNAAVSDELCFLIIGDLSFFYDMNSLWNRYIRKNVRIMLNNNLGAGIFHVMPGEKLLPTLDEYTAARHNQTAELWAKSCGFRYLSAKNKEDFDSNLQEFLSDEGDEPVLFEVFTEKESDAALLKKFYNGGKMDHLLQGKKSTLIKTALNKLKR